MKKVTILLVGVTYVVAIIVVAVLGVLAEVHNVTIDVQSIVLIEARDLPAGNYLTYPETSAVPDSQYAIFSRPGADGEGQTEYPIEWNIGGIRYDYVIQIRGYSQVMSDAWKEGKGNFSVESFVLPENATFKTLDYALFEDNGNTPSDITISKQGLIHFEQERTGIFTFNARISATDNSYTVCNIRFIVVGSI